MLFCSFYCSHKIFPSLFESYGFFTSGFFSFATSIIRTCIRTVVYVLLFFYISYCKIQTMYKFITIQTFCRCGRWKSIFCFDWIVCFLQRWLLFLWWRTWPRDRRWWWPTYLIIVANNKHILFDRLWNSTYFVIHRCIFFNVTRNQFIEKCIIHWQICCKK